MDLLPLLDELQIIARNGLTYDGDPHDSHDKERYKRILDLVSEGYGQSLDLPTQEIRDRLSADEFGHITPKVGAAAALFDENGQILLVKQPSLKTAGNGKWVMPGGYVDPGEQPVEAAVRETREETGLKVRPVSLVDGYWIDAPTKDGPHGAVTLLYYCHVVGGDLKACNESQAVRYWSIEEVPSWFTYAYEGAKDAYEIWLNSNFGKAIKANKTLSQPRTRVTSDPGMGVNEDVGGVTWKGAWVLDGATGISDENFTPGRSDAQWYVKEFDNILRNTINDSSRDLRTIVSDGIQMVSKKFEKMTDGYEIDRATEPSAACSIVRWVDGILEVYILGDCSVLVTYGDGEIQHLTDERELLRRLEREAVNGMHGLMTERGLERTEAKNIIWPKLEHNRQKLREDREHWSLSLDPKAPESGFYTRIDAATINQIQLLSDGVGTLVEDLSAFATWNEFAEWITSHGHEKTINRLRSIEQEDRACEIYPRIKPHDDATLVSVDFK
ncbi:NUDIX hydrolase N-terminal domain-containing protein [Halopelagius longus]|uniref:ADP-ribose pyrophosphatase YjhB, NUDIX family n=1 Tax=Halopelagius longus TaxID=1236180 RepID=A0A1H1GW05_9EURY|nr:NUDIX hydrolase N-terminal domain-containing protein [Halopelagius longus]RDI69542.1 NUDIX domain-containing protein [Halopelagius longus]SDR17078.1 ADP-ribose pyrophosphatase YjhB, NUDIX family [Halopelagius longus]